MLHRFKRTVKPPHLRASVWPCVTAAATPRRCPGAGLYTLDESVVPLHADADLALAVAACFAAQFQVLGDVQVDFDATGIAAHALLDPDKQLFIDVAAGGDGRVTMSQVSISWGDTNFPDAGPVHGSSATMCTGAAVMAAARDARSKLGTLVGAPAETLDVAAALRRTNAEIVGEGKFALAGDAPFDADGATTPYAMRTWGAIFVEVGVDPDFGLIRLRRVVGSYSAGRIINPKTARSQMTGGVIWGWGMAAMEQTPGEPTYGRWLAKNLSNVSVPVNADIPPTSKSTSSTSSMLMPAQPGQGASANSQPPAWQQPSQTLSMTPLVCA